jgi:two-component system cell cycle sensor histidine kinase/response regulator CckA
MSKPIEPHRDVHAQSVPQGASPPPAPSDRTVLLVDDEPSVRRLMETVLRQRGYSVVAAASGDEALRLLEGPEAARFAALVTDVVMPGLGGFDVASRYLETHPGCRALLISGSITADEVRDPRFAGRVEFLAKPFRAAVLVEHVERAITGGRAARDSRAA